MPPTFKGGTHSIILLNRAEACIDALPPSLFMEKPETEVIPCYDMKSRTPAKAPRGRRSTPEPANLFVG